MMFSSEQPGVTECADNNPFEVLQRSLMNILRSDQKARSKFMVTKKEKKKKLDERKCLFAKEQCDISTEE